MMYVPDNYDLFEQHERQMERAFEHCPKCDKCESPLDYQAYRCDDKLLCWDCAVDWLDTLKEDVPEGDYEDEW